MLGAVRSEAIAARRAYYVDATLGSDTNNGRSPADAWQTIGKINNYTGFNVGDSILFKRGETWALTESLTIPANGLRFGAYGAGANPILDGQDTVDCVTGSGKSGLRFENIEVTQGLDFGFSFSSGSYITLVNCSAHDCGNDNLLFSTCNNCLVSGGTYYNAYARLGDDRFISAIEVMDGCYNITISGVEIYGCDASAFALHYGAGVAVHTHAAGGEMPYNITITGCNIHDQATRCFGIRVNNLKTATMTNRNIIISSNTIQDGAYGGIQLNSVDTTNRVVGVTVNNNIILTNTGQWGFSAYNQDTCSMHHNVITNNNNNAGQQNIAVSSCTNTTVYNNTTYSLYDNYWYSVTIDGATTTNLKFKNNIIGGAVASMMGIAVLASTGTTGMEIDYNLYQYTGVGNRFTWLGVAGTYATWQAAGNDANSPTRGDPLFTNPAGEDFTLQTGSPAIDEGVVIAGITDGYLGVAPDCGYAEKA